MGDQKSHGLVPTQWIETKTGARIERTSRPEDCGVIIELVTMVIKLVTIGGLLLPQATSIATEQIKPAGY
jgi:hypothetical protein